MKKVTQAELDSRERDRQITQIDQELRLIDEASVRPSRAIEKARSQNKDPNQTDIDRLAELEDAAELLREQRDELNNGDDIEIEWPEWRL